jgi:hypothetical protein
MKNIAKILIGIAAVAFVLAVVGSLAGGSLLNVAPEALSRASNNLALIAIGIALCFK